MRKTAFVTAFATFAWTTPVSADTRSEIAALEQAWGQAFLKGDRAFLEKLVAPEFRLLTTQGGTVDITPRDRWFANADGFVFNEFAVETVDVADAGDTAVATVTGRWKISRKGLPGTRDTGFIVSDTFVRRGGAWQVVYRHSSPAATPAAKGAERGE